MTRLPALLSAALLLLLLPGTLTQRFESLFEPVPIDVVVESPSNTRTFRTQVAKGGILLGALKTLMASNADFKFTYKENPNYGVYLESVNGVAGDDKDHTYWQLLVETPAGKTIIPDVGIGCYIPSAHEKIILKFTKW